MSSHASAARHLLQNRSGVVDAVMLDAQSAPVSEKMRALLAIADKVRRDGRLVNAADVKRAKDAGADDRALHDTVLITAMFCMFNRYVDGLGTSLPDDTSVFDVVGARIAEHGYGSQFKDDAP
jgi:alkylhydroperoxidase family enzyme